MIVAGIVTAYRDRAAHQQEEITVGGRPRRLAPWADVLSLDFVRGRIDEFAHRRDDALIGKWLGDEMTRQVHTFAHDIANVSTDEDDTDIEFLDKMASYGQPVDFTRQMKIDDRHCRWLSARELQGLNALCDRAKNRQALFCQGFGQFRGDDEIVLYDQYLGWTRSHAQQTSGKRDSSTLFRLPS